MIINERRSKMLERDVKGVKAEKLLRTKEMAGQVHK